MIKKLLFDLETKIYATILQHRYNYYYQLTPSLHLSCFKKLISFLDLH